MTVASWAALTDLPDSRPEGLSDDEWSRVIAQASEVLYQLSGGRYGGSRRRLVEVWAPPREWTAPAALTHEYLLLGVCGGGAHDCCGSPTSLRLPGFPVTEVHSVSISGVVRDPSTYRLHARRFLEAIRGGWPVCSGVLVDYTAGRDAPAGAREAAVDYALALGEARIDPERSRLPGHVTSIARQAVTITYRTALDFTSAGKVGVPSVDHWLNGVNPTGRRHRPSSWSPETDSRFYPQPTT